MLCYLCGKKSSLNFQLIKSSKSIALFSGGDYYAESIKLVMLNCIKSLAETLCIKRSNPEEQKFYMSIPETDL